MSNGRGSSLGGRRALQDRLPESPIETLHQLEVS